MKLHKRIIHCYDDTQFRQRVQQLARILKLRPVFAAGIQPPTYMLQDSKGYTDSLAVRQLATFSDERK